MAPTRISRSELETARARDFYRYYHPFSQQLNADGVCGRPTHPKDSTSTPFRDPALVAFAEVGAVRLKARRAIIAFFDRHWQYVLAEATCETDDDLWLGPCVVPRGNSCCEYTAELESQNEHTPQEGPRVTVISDLTKSERFCQKPFVVGRPHGRFYAGVPIRTPQGFNIGAFCILDDSPREGLTPAQTAFLKEMGLAVMTHLDRIRATAEQQRAGRMIRGLGNFISGRSGCEDWWCQTNRDRDPQAPPTLVGPNDAIIQNTNPEQDIPQSSFDTEDESALRTPESTPPSSASDASKVLYKGLLSAAVVSTFQRAAKLVCDALDVDGVLFLDAAISSYGGLVSTSRRTSSMNSASRFRPRTSQGHQELNDGLLSTEPGSEAFKASRIARPSTETECGVLGHSTSDSGGITKSSMSQRLLQSMLQRYPRGRIWCFDGEEQTEAPESPSILTDMSTSDSYLDHLDQGVFRTGVRSNERQVLRELFPGVRSLAFAGLRDSHKDRWFAGSIIWTCDPVRVFASENEMSYLSAFGDTIMAEVARVDVKSAEKEKTDFISSISHELRSPLHGILGSVECLQETSLDASQHDLLHTVKTCGETLLDTVRHLLDHAKIQKFARQSDASPQSTSFSKDLASLECDVNLSVLIEEAVDTVFAGHAFVSTNMSMPDENKALAFYPQLSQPQPRPVSVSLSISNGPASSWIFQTSAGAWRRIVLSLVGNSLKYTENGCIDVKLAATQLETTTTTTEKANTRISLTITDTGKGMSEDFLQNKLFEPFAQEDSLMPGTGLGMSMCRQIVDSLGGRIQVQSEKNQGTTVYVTVDLVNSIDREPIRDENTIMEKYRGLRVNFFGIDPQDRAHPMKEIVSSLDHTLKNWLAIEFVSTLDPVHADIHMTTQDRIAKDSLGSLRRGNIEPLPGPLIVLCDTISSAHALKTKQGHSRLSNRVVEYISQPCGPRKLTKALDICLRSRDVPKVDDTDASTSGDTIRHYQPTDSPLEVSSNDETVTKNFKDPLICPSPINTKIISASSNSLDLPACEDDGMTDSKKFELEDLPTPEPHWTPDTTPTEASSNVSQYIPEPPASSLKVLLVDDNAVNLKILATFLKRRGYLCTIAGNGLEALELYKASASSVSSNDKPRRDEDYLSRCSARPRHASDPFYFVLMDINMPVMDGFESTRHIRAFERDNSLSPARIIALTGLASAQAQQEAFGSGVDLFLTKPVRLKELMKIMENSGLGEQMAEG